MNKHILSLLAILPMLAMLTGCVSGTHIITGNQHQPIPVDAVMLYQVAPPKYEIVGLVNSSARGSRQLRMDRATHELKRQAAKMGANGIILNPVESGGLADRKIKLSGQAIYVLP